MTFPVTMVLAAALGLATAGQPAGFSGPPEAAAAASFLRAEDYRVASIGYRLAVAGKAHCPTLLPITGMSLHYLPEYGADTRAQAALLYGLAAGPGIVSVIDGSPAARAGLLAGDVLLSVNNVPLPDGDALARSGAGNEWRKETARIESELEEKLRLGPVRLKLLRQGRQLELALDSVPGCPVRNRLARSRQANAFADGRTAIMTTRMLEFVANDDELAVVLAHEAAHNILGHPARLQEEKVPKGFLGNFGKNAKRVRATEEEADRLGLKLVWSAGYDLSAAIPFWRRLYGRFDPIPTPKLFSRHPSLAARERIVEEVTAELATAPQPPS